MPSTHPECQAGPSPGWNLVAMGLVAVVVALTVALFVPPAPSVDEPSQTLVTYPTSCTDGDRLCAAVEALEDARDDPGLTPAERELVEALDDEIDQIINPPTTVPPPPPPPTTTRPTTTTTSTTSSSTTTSTSTTVPPRVPRDPLQIGRDILADLLPTTTPEDPDGDP